MRSKFPVIWIFQLLFLSTLGLIVFFAPTTVLEFLRGREAPKAISKPEDALYGWVLALKEIPVPNESVKAFFADHQATARPGRGDVWTPFDKDISSYVPEKIRAREKIADSNHAWEEVEKWILSATPKPDSEDEWLAIQNWLDVAQVIEDFWYSSDRLRINGLSLRQAE